MGPQYIKQKLIAQGVPVLRVDGDVIWITDRLAVYFNPYLRMSIMRASPVLPRTRWTHLAEERNVTKLAESLLEFIQIDKETPRGPKAVVVDLQAHREKRVGPKS
jgi:hypothetical protein